MTHDDPHPRHVSWTLLSSISGDPGNTRATRPIRVQAAHPITLCPGAGPALGFAAPSPSLGFGITKGVHHARKARRPDERERQLQREAWTSRRSRQEKFDEV